MLDYQVLKEKKEAENAGCMPNTSKKFLERVDQNST
jgi:hypothetical protein